MLRRKPQAIILVAGAVLFGWGSAMADVVVDSVNASATPYAGLWNATDVGWNFTATSSYQLTDLETIFGSVPDLRTVTAVVMTNTPSNGGMLLASGTFVPVAGVFSGATFAPVNVTLGENLFLGFENVGGLGANVTSDAGATSLGSLHYDGSTNGSFSLTESGGFTSQPILELTGVNGTSPVPEPGAWMLLLTVLVTSAPALRRLRRATKQGD